MSPAITRPLSRMRSRTSAKVEELVPCVMLLCLFCGVFTCGVFMFFILLSDQFSACDIRLMALFTAICQAGRYPDSDLYPSTRTLFLAKSFAYPIRGRSNPDVQPRLRSESPPRSDESPASPKAVGPIQPASRPVAPSRS